MPNSCGDCGNSYTKIKDEPDPHRIGWRIITWLCAGCRKEYEQRRMGLSNLFMSKENRKEFPS